MVHGDQIRRRGSLAELTVILMSAGVAYPVNPIGVCVMAAPMVGWRPLTDCPVVVREAAEAVVAVTTWLRRTG